MRPPLKELANTGWRVVFNEDGTLSKLIDDHGKTILSMNPYLLKGPFESSIAVPAATFVAPVASDDGTGKLKLTSAGAHGLTSQALVAMEFAVAGALPDGAYLITSTADPNALVFDAPYDASIDATGMTFASTLMIKEVVIPAGTLVEHGLRITAMLSPHLAATGAVFGAKFASEPAVPVCSVTLVGATATEVPYVAQIDPSLYGLVQLPYDLVAELSSMSISAIDPTVEQTLQLFLEVTTEGESAYVSNLTVSKI